MRIGIYILLISQIWTGGLFAQAIVKSGEHTDFSRLVVYLPKSQEWSANNTENGYKISVPEWDEGFDVSSIFEMIPRTRISEVLATRSGIELSLACACSVTAKPLSNGGIIIDVGAVELVVLDGIVDATKTDAIELPTQDLQGELLAKAFSDDADQKEPTPDLEPFRRALMENLGRSASLSLVDLNPDARSTNRPASASDKKMDKSNADLDRFEESGRLRITTALDAAQNDLRQKPAPKVRDVCPDPSLFMVSEWGNEISFGDQLGKLRKAALAEFDKQNLGAIRDLVRFYLHVGFGVEARAAMAAFDVAPAANSQLLALSNVIESEADASSGMIAKHIQCDARIAIWSILDGAGILSLSDQQIKKIVGEFASWPIHMQEYLGPRLLEAIMVDGGEEAAGVIRNIISRPTGEVTSALTLLSVRHSDRDTVDGQKLKEIIEEGGDNAAEALEFYLRRLMEEGQKIDPSLLDLASAYAKELADLPVSNSLRNMYLSGLAHSGNFETSLVQLNMAMNEGWDLESGLSSRLLRSFLDGASSEQLSRFALILIGEVTNHDIETELAILLTQRFLATGMPVLADAIFREFLTVADHPLIAAEIAVALKEITRAVSILEQTSAEEKYSLLASLMLKNDRPAVAWNELRDMLPENMRDEVAWAASQWDGVNNDGPSGEAASLLRSSPETDLVNAPITSAQTLREESRATREVINRLLDFEPS